MFGKFATTSQDELSKLPAGGGGVGGRGTLVFDSRLKVLCKRLDIHVR